MDLKKDGVNFLGDADDLSPGGKLLLKTPNMKQRRKSSFVRLTASQTEYLKHRRMTRTGLSDAADEKHDDKPKVKMENTYKIEPDSSTRFSSCKVKNEIMDTFEQYLSDVKYERDRCSKLCVDLSVAVKNNVKALGFPRYKIICNVIIGQCKDQGFETASRAVWDERSDNMAYAVYKNSSLFAVGIVHGVYFE